MRRTIYIVGSVTMLLMTSTVIPAKAGPSSSTSKSGITTNQSKVTTPTAKPYPGFGVKAPTKSEMAACAKNSASMTKCATGR